MASYNTVRGDAITEFTVNRSRFIGYCFKVGDEDEALLRLESIRKKHHDATHNCYAYAVGDNGSIARYSDDGEPGGTAGLPMMDVLKKRGLTYTLVVATRYFGGILLGAGGLVRAYTKTTADAVDAAGVCVMKLTPFYRLKVTYPMWGRVESWLRSGSFGEVSAEYGENVSATVAVPPELSQSFEKDCTELTDGRVEPVLIRQIFYGW